MAELRKVEYFISRPLSSIICKCYFFFFSLSIRQRLNIDRATSERTHRGDLKSREANQSCTYDELSQSEYVYDPFQSVREPVNRFDFVRGNEKTILTLRAPGANQQPALVLGEFLS